MEAGIRAKISLIFCIVCFLEIYATPLQTEKRLLLHSTKSLDDDSSFKQHWTKSIAKRNADWSKKLSPSHHRQVTSEEAEASENVEVSSKPPRMVRRMRIHHGAQKIMQSQNAEDVKEIGPEYRSGDGGVKIVRVKKFRRRPIRHSTTAVPDTTMITTGNPYAVSPRMTTNSEYSHITVVNKEVKSPKRNKKRKNKRPVNERYPTTLHDSETKQNGITYVTVLPEIQFSKPDVFVLNRQTSHPDYEGYFRERQAANTHQGQFLPKAEHFQNQQSSPFMHEKHFSFEPPLSRTFKPLLPASDSVFQTAKPTSSGINRKYSEQFPSYCCIPYFGKEMHQFQTTTPTNRDIKTSSVQPNVTEQSKVLVEPTIETNSSAVDSVQTKVTVQRSGDSVTTVPTLPKQKPTLSKRKEPKINKTLTPTPHPKPKIPYQRQHQMPRNPNKGNMNPFLHRYPTHYPSFLYDQQHEFADPFFADSPDLHNSPMHRNNQGHSFISPLHLPFSPFYSPNSPPSEEYIFADTGHPYQSSGLIVPGFHHSPQLRSLRRSFIEEDVEETTEAPVTPFSLPKFEMPSIDFNDKGCQTVYKEVKTVPGDQPRSEGEKAKSFVLTRECYFPNGIPTTETTEKTEIETTKEPVTTQKPKKEMM